MADEKKQTLKEIQEKRKKDIESLEANLKSGFYLNVLGVNDLRSQHNLYGDLGEKAANAQYASVYGSSDADKLRKQLYEDAVKEREGLGIADMPEYTSNFQLTKYVLGIMHDSVMQLPLGNLEKTLEGIDKGVKLNIPAELKAYEEKITKEIIAAQAKGKTPEEIKKTLKADKVSEDTIDTYKQVAYLAIRRAAAFRFINEHKYDDFNSSFDKLGKDYRKAKGIPEPEAAPKKETSKPKKKK